MSQKAKRKSIPVHLEKAQEKSESEGIRPKMQLNVPESVVASIKTKEQKIEEEQQKLQAALTEHKKDEFKTRCYFYGAVIAGAGVCYLTWRYFFKSNPPPAQLVGAIINGSV